MLRRSYDLLYSLVRAIAVTLLVLLALYVSLGRNYVGYVSMYRGEVIERFNTATGLEVQAEQLDGRWSGLSPVFTLTDFGLAGSAGAAPAITASRIEIEFDVIASLLARAPKIRHADVDGLALQFTQDEAGGWQLADFSGGGGGVPPWLIDTLLAVRLADVRDARAMLDFFEGERAEIALPTARFAGDGFFRRAVVELALQDSGPVHLIAESEDDPRQLEQFQGSVYLQLDRANFASLRNVLPEQYRRTLDTQLDGQLWLQRDARQRLLVHGNIASPEFAVGAFWNRADQVLSNTESTFSAVYTEDRWSVWFAEAGLNWGEEYLELGNIEVSGEVGDPRLRTYMPEVQVDQILGILRDGPIPESLDTLLRELKPSGRLRHVVVYHEPGAADFEDLVATAELEDVSLQAWRGAPGAIGVNGWVEAGIRGGRVLIDTPSLELDFPKLYDQPLRLQETRAEVLWRLTDERVFIDSGVIESFADGSPVAGLLALDLPVKSGGDAPLMTLSIGVSDADIGLRDQFVPKTLPDALLKWLRSSVGAGRVDQAGFIYRGSTRAGDSDNRTVQLYARLRDTTLRFHEQWPAVNAVSSTLLLDDADVRTFDTTARMFDKVALRDLSVTVRTANGQSRLGVSGTARGAVDELLRVYRESMLSEVTGGAFEDWSGTGNIDLDISLDMPLAQGGTPPKVDVLARLNNNRVAIDALNLELTAAEGEVRYRNGVVNSDALRARLFDRPMQLSIKQTAGSPIVTTASAPVAMRSVQQWLDQPIFTLMDGVAQVEAVITSGADRADVVLRSDLVGVTLDVPPPFDKKAQDKRRLRVRMPLRGDRRVLRTEIEKLGNIALTFANGKPEGMAVTLGHADQLAVGAAGAITISGNINQTPLLPWKTALDRYLTANEKHAQKRGPSTGPDWQVRVENLGIGALDVDGFELEELVLTATSPLRDSDSWEVDIAGPMLVGRIRLPRDDADPFDIKLQRLQLPEHLLAAEESAEVASDERPIEPDTLPAMDLYVGQLLLGDAEFGSLGFQLRPIDGAAVLRNLRGNIRGALLSKGDLIWTGAGRGRAESTQFSGSFSVPDVGNTLQAFGYERVLEAKNARMDVSLRWTGGPDQFELLASDGFFGVATEKGRLPSSPEGATGALRIVGIFNLSNLIRRMQFDFSDLFEQGIAFDSIKGRIELARGVMQIPNGLEVKGPSSKFVLNGAVDFNTDQTDMQLVATLPVASNLPWVAALVGGLPAAAGVFVASKIFEKQVDRFSSAVYEISGPWQDPQLKFKRVFDDKAPVSKNGTNGNSNGSGGGGG